MKQVLNHMTRTRLFAYSGLLCWLITPFLNGSPLKQSFDETGLILIVAAGISWLVEAISG